MSEYDFFTAQSDASAIKTRIVTKYFKFWASVMLKAARPKGSNIAYFDFFAGPGQFDDGTKSTPILILEYATSDEQLRKRLVTVFNDRDHADILRRKIAEIEGIQTLVHQPRVHDLEVDGDFASVFSNIDLIPSFTFIDPFGYKGVTLELLRGMLKGWGCDLILFFSYNRINAAITNKSFEDHARKLFGDERLTFLRNAVQGRRPYEREAIILEAFTEALREMGFNYVLPFTFQRPGVKRVAHHLIFISKHKLAYTVMKEIMAAESSEENQGVPTFTYSTSLSKDETPLLYLLEQPIEGLGESLLRDFLGRTMSVEDVFESHHVGKPFILRNYKDALLTLEQQGKIIASPRRRRSYRGVPSMANNVMITFPAED